MRTDYRRERQLSHDFFCSLPEVEILPASDITKYLPAGSNVFRGAFACPPPPTKLRESL